MSEACIRMEINDQHGTAAFVLNAIDMLARQHALIAELARRAMQAVASLPGVANEDHAREILLSELIRQHADQLAYERVAGQRGLLPL